MRRKGGKGGGAVLTWPSLLILTHAHSPVAPEDPPQSTPHPHWRNLPLNSCPLSGCSCQISLKSSPIIIPCACTTNVLTS